jgi:hypothetical protein
MQVQVAESARHTYVHLQRRPVIHILGAQDMPEYHEALYRRCTCQTRTVTAVLGRGRQVYLAPCEAGSTMTTPQMVSENCHRRLGGLWALASMRLAQAGC